VPWPSKGPPVKPGAVGLEAGAPGAEVVGAEAAGGFDGVVVVGCRCRSGLEVGEDSWVVGEGWEGGGGVLGVAAMGLGVAAMAVGAGISEEGE